MRAGFIHEPRLEFAAGTHVDIRFGIMNHGPLDALPDDTDNKPTAANAQDDWVSRGGRQDRSVRSGGYRRIADTRASKRFSCSSTVERYVSARLGFVAHDRPHLPQLGADQHAPGEDLEGRIPQAARQRILDLGNPAGAQGLPNHVGRSVQTSIRLTGALAEVGGHGLY